MKKGFLAALVALSAMALTGCGTTYTTPAGGVSLAEIDDTDLREHFAAEPASSFPANIAVARLQDRGYFSNTSFGHGVGRYSVVTTRDVETDESFESIGSLPHVRDVAPIGRLLLPPRIDSIDDLRAPAARLKADLLLVYSIDSTFVVDGEPVGPLSAISLGFIKNREAHVTSTVAGALVDVRTGFVYGTAEATERESKRANIWSTRLAADSARIAAEQRAFDAFVDSFAELWTDVTDTQATAGQTSD